MMSIFNRGAILASTCLAVLSVPAAAQPTAPPDPPAQDESKIRSAELSEIQKTSQDWQDDEKRGEAPDFLAKRKRYNTLYRKNYAKREELLKKFAEARDEKVKKKLMEDAYEIADVLNKAIKPDLLERDGDIEIARSSYKDYNPAKDVDQGLRSLNQDLTGYLVSLKELINSNKKAESRKVLDAIRRRIKALEELDRRQGFVETYLFDNAMFRGDTERFRRSFKDRRDRNTKLRELYEDYEKAYEQKWPDEEAPNGPSREAPEQSSSIIPQEMLDAEPVSTEPIQRQNTEQAPSEPPQELPDGIPGATDTLESQNPEPASKYRKADAAR